MAQADANEYAWVLVNEKAFDGLEDVQRYEANDQYSVRAVLQNNDSSVDYRAAKTFIDKTAASVAQIGVPAVEIPVYEPVEIPLRLLISENELGDASANARVHVCGYGSTPESPQPLVHGGQTYAEADFTNAAGRSTFTLNSVDGYDPIETVLSKTLPAGTESYETLAICVDVTLEGVMMGTKYMYQWLPMGYRGNLSSLGEQYVVPKDEQGDYIDTGVRVSDISGEVYVRRGDDVLGWEFLNLGDVIYEGDVIQVKGGDSGVILGLADMTTFKMAPNSSVRVDMFSEEESKLALLAGKVLVNVKKMVTDGTLKVEMSQAVAGIKGTIFIAESDGDVSRLQVLEGSVELTNTNGAQVMVGANQSVVATPDGFSALVAIDKAEVGAYWGDMIDAEIGLGTQTNPNTSTNEKSVASLGSTATSPFPYLVLGGVILLFGFVAWIWFARRS